MRITDLIDELEPLAGKERSKARAPYWIEGPEGLHFSSHSGFIYCAECSYFVCRWLRRRDRKQRDQYFRSGGYRTEEDSLCFCAGCGCTLDVSLSRYGASEEVAHFASYGVTPADVFTAFALQTVLEAVEWAEEGDESLAEEAAGLVEAFLWCAT